MAITATRQDFLDYLRSHPEWEGVQRALREDYNLKYSEMDELTDDQLERLADEFDFYSNIWGAEND